MEFDLKDLTTCSIAYMLCMSRSIILSLLLKSLCYTYFNMKYLKMILVLIVVLSIGATIFIMLNSNDLTEINDSDLLLEPAAPLAVDDNAYYLLLDTADQPELSDQQVTDSFITAANKPVYQCPLSLNQYSPENEVCQMNYIRDQANLVAQRASSSFASGRAQDGIDSTIAIIKMAHLLDESRGSLVNELIAIALYDIAIKPLRANSLNITPLQREEVRVAIDSFGPTNIDFSDAFRYDYQFLKKAYQQVSLETQIGYRWQPNRTINELAIFYRLMIQKSKLACGVSDPLVEQNLSKQFDQYQDIFPEVLVQPNSVGKILVSLAIGSTSGMNDQVCEVKSSYDNLLSAL